MPPRAGPPSRGRSPRLSADRQTRRTPFASGPRSPDPIRVRAPDRGWTDEKPRAVDGENDCAPQRVRAIAAPRRPCGSHQVHSDAREAQTSNVESLSPRSRPRRCRHRAADARRPLNDGALDDGEALTATRATRGEHSTTAGGSHARAKPVHARAAAGLWLIGALQGPVPSRRNKTIKKRGCVHVSIAVA
jgi:hypothetical protein